MKKLLALLRQNGRLEMTLFLAAMTLFCFGIALFRVYVSETRYYLFLIWNLFLAFIPWAASSAVMLFPFLRAQKPALFLLLAIWLLFFPNSPYILTDLVHVRASHGIYIWYDLLAILTFAWTGLLYGFISLTDVEKLLSARFKSWIAGSIVAGLLFLGSFGVYLGRFLRFNSWDVIQNPFQLFGDIVTRIVNPFVHFKTWGMTLFLGLLLNLMFWSIRILQHATSSQKSA